MKNFEVNLAGFIAFALGVVTLALVVKDVITIITH